MDLNHSEQFLSSIATSYPETTVGDLLDLAERTGASDVLRSMTFGEMTGVGVRSTTTRASTPPQRDARKVASPQKSVQKSVEPVVATIMAFLAAHANEWFSPAQITENNAQRGMVLTPLQLRRVLNDLLADKKVKRRGVTRGTQYQIARR